MFTRVPSKPNLFIETSELGMSKGFKKNPDFNPNHSCMKVSKIREWLVRIVSIQKIQMKQCKSSVRGLHSAFIMTMKRWWYTRLPQ